MTSWIKALVFLFLLWPEIRAELNSTDLQYLTPAKTTHFETGFAFEQSQLTIAIPVISSGEAVASSKHTYNDGQSVLTNKLIRGVGEELELGLSWDYLIFNEYKRTESDGVLDSTNNYSQKRQGLSDPVFFARHRVLSRNFGQSTGHLKAFLSPSFLKADYDWNSDSPQTGSAASGGPRFSLGGELGHKKGRGEIQVSFSYIFGLEQESTNLSTNRANRISRYQDWLLNVDGRYQYKDSWFLLLGAEWASFGKRDFETDLANFSRDGHGRAEFSLGALKKFSRKLYTHFSAQYLIYESYNNFSDQTLFYTEKDRNGFGLQAALNFTF